MKPHPEINQQGAKAYRIGMEMEDNPYKKVSHIAGGVFKAAAWDAGYIQEKLKHNPAK